MRNALGYGVLLAIVLMTPDAGLAQRLDETRMPIPHPAFAPSVPNLPLAPARPGAASWRTRAVIGAVVGCGGLGYLVARNAQKGEKLPAGITGCALGLVPGAIVGATFFHESGRSGAGLFLHLPRSAPARARRAVAETP